MGFSSSIRLITRENNEVIEIYPSEAESIADSDIFTLEHLFNSVLLDEIYDVAIELSKITVLDLSGCNLTELPVAFKKLDLRHLKLSHNNLERAPLCLYSGLKHLQSLDLSHNNIHNFDMEPDCMPFIRTMKLNNNEFYNVPKWFLTFRCTSMEEFNYSNNKAKHYKFLKNSFNVNLLKLKKLELCSSCLIDQDFNLLKCFKQLQYLDISNDKRQHINRFDDLDELFVKPKWKELHVLKMNGLSISIFPEGIAWLESLKELYACDNSLSWLPDDIKFLVNLEVLCVSDNRLISLPKGLLTMEKLRILQAANNCIEGTYDFSSMSNLKTLDLYNNLIDKILFNVNTVDFVDIEGNYCDTSELQEYTLYEEKKSNLRKGDSLNDRKDGSSTEQSGYLTESSSERDSDYDDEAYECTDKKISTPCNIDLDEDWDLPVKIRTSCADIDSEDDMWQGEEQPSLKVNSERTKIYVSDDDWMFVDFEES